MKIFGQTSEEFSMIKCLECRLIGRPPKFAMQPPPAPSADILAQLNLDPNLNDFITSKKHLKKCINKSRSIIEAAFSATDNSAETNSISTNNDVLIQSSASLVTSSTPFILNSTQSFYIFVMCLIVFFLVLFVAFLFLIKLYRIKKQLESQQSISNSKSTSDLLINKNRQQIFNCLSSSLSSTSASSTTSSNTISSNLILTPTSLLPEHSNSNNNNKDTNCSKTCLYNQLFTFNPNSTSYLHAVPFSCNQMKQPDEYAEINSQTYKYEKNIIYNQYDESALNSNSAYSIDSNSQLGPLIRHSRALLANQSGLLFLNQSLINNTNNTENLFKTANFYYGC